MFTKAREENTKQVLKGPKAGSVQKEPIWLGIDQRKGDNAYQKKSKEKEALWTT